jgi:hypothetical protein
MGRYTFSIFLRVRLSSWFLDVVADRPVITVISRLIFNHTRVRAHLSRINIVAEALCGCGCDYETVDHRSKHFGPRLEEDHTCRSITVPALRI